MVQHANQAGTSQVKAVEHEHAIDSKSVDIASLEAHHSCTDAPGMSSSEVRVSVSAAYIEPESGRTLKVLSDGTLVILPGISKPPIFAGSEITIPPFIALVAAPPSQAPAVAPASAATVATARQPEKSASAPSSPKQPLVLPNDGRSQTIPEVALARAGSASAAAPPQATTGSQQVAVKVEEAAARPAEGPAAAGHGQQASSEATEQGGSPSGVDAADKANSELLLNFANSAATEQAQAASAPPVTAAVAADHAATPPASAATTVDVATTVADSAAAAQRHAAADMLVRRLLDTIAQQSPGMALPGEAAVMQSLLQLSSKCMDRHVAPSEAELRAALERCLQCVRPAASASGLATAGTPRASAAAAAAAAAAAQGGKAGGKGTTLPALAFTAPPATASQNATIHHSSQWNSAALASLQVAGVPVGNKRPADTFPQSSAANPKTHRPALAAASIPALPAIGSQSQADPAAPDSSPTPTMSQRDHETMQLLRSLHGDPNVAIKILQKAMDRQVPGQVPTVTSPPPPLQAVPPSPTPPPESPGANRRALLQLLQQNPHLLTMLEQNPGNESLRAMLNAVLNAAMTPPTPPPPPPELPVVLRDMQQAGAGDPAIMHALQTLMQQRLLQSHMPNPPLAHPATSFFAPSSAAPNSTSMPLHTIPMSLLKAAAAAKNPVPATAAAPVEAGSYGAFPRDGRRLSAADEGAVAAIARLQQMQSQTSPQLTADLMQRAAMLRPPAASQPGPPTSAHGGVLGLDAAALERLGQHMRQPPGAAAQIAAMRPTPQDASHTQQLLQLLDTMARRGGAPLRRQSSGQPNGASST